MKPWKYLLLCPLLAAASFNAAACYTVFDRANRVVYQGENPPVDMSKPLHETLFPGAHLVFDAGATCPTISPVAFVRSRSSEAPLLTDRKTAEEMKVPHRILPSGVALVMPKDAVVAPSVTVLPTALAARPSTSVMGAGPSRGAVITELRDPPVTIEQSGGRITTVR